jgi:hypothetical protein
MKNKSPKSIPVEMDIEPGEKNALIFAGLFMKRKILIYYSLSTVFPTDTKDDVVILGRLIYAIAMPQYIAQFVEFAEIHPPVFIIINSRKFPHAAQKGIGSFLFVSYGKQRLQKCPI